MAVTYMQLPVSSLPQGLREQHLRRPGSHHGCRALPAAARRPCTSVLLTALGGGPRQGLPLLAIGQVMTLAGGYACGRLLSHRGLHTHSHWRGPEQHRMNQHLTLKHGVRPSFDTTRWESHLRCCHGAMHHHLLQLQSAVLCQGAVGPGLLMEGPLGGPPPQHGVEDQGDHVPGYEHVHRVVLARGNDEDGQHEDCTPRNDLHQHLVACWRSQ